MPETMGTREASEKWGYSMSTIAIWCNQGRIPGAKQYKNRGPWAIPIDAVCPKRLRKDSKEKNE